MDIHTEQEITGNVPGNHVVHLDLHAQLAVCPLSQQLAKLSKHSKMIIKESLYVRKTPGNIPFITCLG